MSTRIRADELFFDPDAMFHAGDMMMQGYVRHRHLIDHEDEGMIPMQAAAEPVV